MAEIIPWTDLDCHQTTGSCPGNCPRGKQQQAEIGENKSKLICARGFLFYLEKFKHLFYC